MVLILLCTFDDGNIINSSRSNIDVRVNDYYIAINKWLNNNNVNNYIIIENSGFVSEKINLLIQNYKNMYNKKNIEFLQFNGQNFDRNLGKGFGVYVSLINLVENSNLFSLNNNFIILPGRYYISNFEKILNSSKAELISDFQKKLTYAFTPMLLCSKTFMTKYLLNELINSNDANGIHYEHCLAKSVHRAIADGINWDLPCEVPIIEGISGTTNLPYYKNIYHKNIILIYSKIKYFVFSFSR